MNIRRWVVALGLLLCANACSSGGGGSDEDTEFASWEKFRHDGANTGQAAGELAENGGGVRWRTQIDGSPIRSSPAVGQDDLVYIATQGGTIAALDLKDGAVRWTVCACDGTGSGVPAICPVGQPPEFGAFVGSPATYFQDTREGKGTYLHIGSHDGTLLGIRDDAQTRTCTMRFRPRVVTAGAGDTVRAVRFDASPTYTVNVATFALAAVFGAASVDVEAGGQRRTIGKLYAVNTDGTLSWEFPRLGQPEIGGITASPVLDSANTVYVTADDGYLYAIDRDGNLRWRFAVTTATGAPEPFAPSPTTSVTIFAPTVDGTIVAVNPDGTFSWRTRAPDGASFIASLAVGLPAVTPTPTASPEPSATPAPDVTASPTPTATPVLSSFEIFAVTRNGAVLAVNVRTGQRRLVDVSSGPIAGPVVSSPALSGDAYLVIGDASGRLHALDTTTGLQPEGWPVLLSPDLAILSSPAIDADGFVYVGTMDGYLYSIGDTAEPTAVPTHTPTPTRTVAATATRTVTPQLTAVIEP
jgi:outer membrane protein assembly factor BamB